MLLISVPLICLYKWHVSLLQSSLRGNILLFRVLSLILFKYGGILKTYSFLLGAMRFQQHLQRYVCKFTPSTKHKLKDKPDMIEANMTYLWQMTNDIYAKIPCASIPASCRTQPTFIPAKAGHANAGKQAKTVRLRPMPGRSVVFHSRRRSATPISTRQLPHSAARRDSLRPDFRFATGVDNSYADTDAFPPVTAVFLSGNTSLPHFSA